jgi:5-methyltetrahydrofolate--homocysteine methyltransferase
MANNFPFKLPFLLDGATATNLYKVGMPVGVCIEKWILENPDALIELQKSFIESKSDAILAPTFSANRAKLSHFGLEDKVYEINKQLVSLTKRAVEAVKTVSESNKKIYIGGDVSPTGLFIEPFGENTFDEIILIYKEQVTALKDAGVDFILCETMMSISDMRAVIFAAKEVNIPVMVSITVDHSGHTLSGANLLSCIVILQSLGACAVGLNCSYGPLEMVDLIKKVFGVAKVPIIAKPNAGLPCAEDSNKFDLDPLDFSKAFIKLITAGASVFGGCCGSTPEHISMLRKVIDEDYKILYKNTKKSSITYAGNESFIYAIDENTELSEPIKCEEDMLDIFLDAEDDIKAICVSVETIDDAFLLSQNSHMLRSPLVISCRDANILDETLKLYQGRAVVDSKSGLDEATLSEKCEKYGALLF